MLEAEKNLTNIEVAVWFFRVVEDIDTLTQPLHKAQLLQACARLVAFFAILHGRLHIDSALATAYPALGPTTRARSYWRGAG
ncbi:hypothetical protein K438DRAFT_1959121 [Mycena galopus ATCC 62051]|nr:hypothetical protein K438DRAFT_1959121 [Mycena galopus ATCC 62051]